MNMVDEIIGRQTPPGMIIIEGALTQLHEDLYAVLKYFIKVKIMKLVKQMDEEEQQIFLEPIQVYDIEVDGI